MENITPCFWTLLYSSRTLHVHERCHAEGDSTTVFRYVDWILTVPLMCVEFYLILKAAGATSKHLRDLVVLSTLMLVFGYVGEAGLGNAALWGLFSGLAYFGIVYMIKFGELAKLAASAGGAVQSAHNTLVLFVIIGWAIYPIGYMVGTEVECGMKPFLQLLTLLTWILYTTLVILSTKLDLV